MCRYEKHNESKHEMNYSILSIFHIFPHFFPEQQKNSTGNISYKFIWMFYYDLFSSGNILLKEIKHIYYMLGIKPSNLVSLAYMYYTTHQTTSILSWTHTEMFYYMWRLFYSNKASFSLRKLFRFYKKTLNTCCEIRKNWEIEKWKYF